MSAAHLLDDSSPPASPREARLLRDAAAFMTGCAELNLPLVAGNGSTLATTTPAIAKPLAAILLGAALQIEAQGSTAGLPVRNALEIAALVMHVDLGADLERSDAPTRGDR